MVTAEIPTRLCPQCWDRKPIDQFRRRRKGSEYRHSQCNTCRTEENRQRAARKRQKAVQSFTRGVNRDRSLRAIQALLDEVARRLGGVDNVAKALVEFREDAIRAGKEHLVLGWIKALVGMMRTLEERSPQQWSEEEIGGFVLEHMAELIDAHPEVLFSVAEERGYTVIPPPVKESE